MSQMTIFPISSPDTIMSWFNFGQHIALTLCRCKLKKAYVLDKSTGIANKSQYYTSGSITNLGLSVMCIPLFLDHDEQYAFYSQ